MPEHVCGETKSICPKCDPRGVFGPSVTVPTAKKKKTHKFRNFVLTAFGLFALMVLASYVFTTPEQRAAERINEERNRAAQQAVKAEDEAAQKVVDDKAKADQKIIDDKLAAEKSRKDAIFMKAMKGATSIRAVMRNPDSLKFSEVLIMPSDAVCYQYRAQNGFGGLNVEEAVLTPQGKIWSNNPPVWNRYCAGHSGEDKTSDADYYSK